MTKIKLNKGMGQFVAAHGFELNPTEKYIINIKDEINDQSAIQAAVQTMGLPALKDYHHWLIENGFDPNMPNPTNDFVSQFYGVKPLSENDDDFYIVMECSRLNEGFKYTQIIVTMGGCL